MKKPKTFLNVDESWLNDMDHRHMKWRVPGTTNSVPTKSVAPRISMIMALDSDGIVYACLTQVNTDSTMMKLYLKELVKMLDKKDLQWRKTHVLLVDGASKLPPSSFDFSFCFSLILFAYRIPLE